MGMAILEPYQELEHKFGEYIGNPHVAVCASGTAALHLAFEVLRALHPELENSHVAIPNTTMVACPRAAVLAEFIPSFVAVDHLGLLDKEVMADSSETVLAVHLYGRKCPTDFVEENRFVIEDLAEAHSIKPNPNSFAACWSFYKNKIICGEEGGAVAFQTKEAADVAKELRSLGMTGAHDFNHRPRGMNYRLSNLQAQPIIKSLANVDRNLTKRKRLEAMYNSSIPQEWQLPTRQSPWVYDIELPEGVNTWHVVQGLVARGVPARLCFKPMTWQAEFRPNVLTGNSSCCSNSVRIANRRIYLPLNPIMDQANVAAIYRALREVVEAQST